MSSAILIDIGKKGTPEVLAKFAISSLRVSTAKQTKESKTGISRQEKAFLRWMDKHPEYRAYEKQFVYLGVSGRGKHRTKGALYQFLEEARRGELPPETCLVVEKETNLLIMQEIQLI